MEGALFARRGEWDGRTIAPAAKQSGAAAGGSDVRDSAFKAGTLELGTAQDSGVVFAWSWGGGQREHVQAGIGTSGADAKAAAAAALD